MQIYVTTWSLRRTILREQLDLTALPAFLAQHGFAGVELTDRELLGCSTEALGALRGACTKANIGVIVDINCDLAEPDESRRCSEMEHVERLLILSASLRARAARITLGGQSVSIQKLVSRLRSRDSTKPAATDRTANPLRRVLAGPLMRRFAHALRTRLPARVRNLDARIGHAVAALRVLTPKARAHGVPLAIENHWGISARPEWILRVVGEIDSEWLGICADFANFPRGVDRYAGLAMLAPKALHAQAKSWRFDERGEEVNIDYARCLRALRRGGYDGSIAIEYEGHGDDLADCLRTRALIQRHWKSVA